MARRGPGGSDETEVSQTDPLAFAPTLVREHTTDTLAGPSPSTMTDPDSISSGSRTVTLYLAPGDRTLPGPDLGTQPVLPMTPAPGASDRREPWMWSLLMVGAVVTAALGAAVILKVTREPLATAPLGSTQERGWALPPIDRLPAWSIAPPEAEPAAGAPEPATATKPRAPRGSGDVRRGSRPPVRAATESRPPAPDPAPPSPPVAPPGAAELRPLGAAKGEGSRPSQVTIVVRKEGKPTPAEVLIDGVSRGQSPLRIELGGGSHLVEVRSRSGETRQQSVHLTGGEPRKVLFDL